MALASVHQSSLVAGRYELEQELARGGMGVVYRARDRATGGAIALKRSVSNDGSSHLTRSALQREYQTLVTLRHPHIIQVYDFGVDERGPYYTMELLDGADLRSKCPLPWREVCAYLRDVASSLALLHSRRLLHCDVNVNNIRLTLAGRAKLIDFGALASFGRSSVIAGTPPTVAPEVLQREELDQRVDLYALGATAYYALCGHHAYPVTMLALLPAIWEQGRPAPPSKYDPAIPRELDELVLALLDLDRMSRPSSAAEVIDRLGAIAGLAPDQDQRVQRSYLYSAEVIGRDHERAQLEDKLQQASSGRGGGVLITGAPGQGKSFLLNDMAQRARVAGARVLFVNALAHGGTLGVWSALVREASVHVGNAPSPKDREASEAVFFRLAESAPLVLAIEDLQHADSDSIASCVALAKSALNKRILLLATLDPAHANADRPVLRSLRKRMTLLELRPFDEKTTLLFVSGLFGDVAAVPRLASFLFSHAAGNPQTYTELIHHLMSEGFIRYAEGTWVLPDELPAIGPGGLALDSLVSAALEDRIARWTPRQRTLARLLSPQRRAFDLALCRTLASGEPELVNEDLEQLLRELVREGVLVEAQGVYTFMRSRIRDTLYGQLSSESKQTLHGRIAHSILAVAPNDDKRGFEVGYHLLLAGEDRKARKHLNRSAAAALAHPDLVIEAVPDLWALLEHQRSVGATDDDVQFIEGVLVFSGYYLDPTIHDRFGARVLERLHNTLGFALATRLSRWLGPGLSLTVGLLYGLVKVALRKRPYLVRGTGFTNSMLVYVSVYVALSGGGTFRLDRPILARLLDTLSLFGRLGRFNAFRISYDLFYLGVDLVGGNWKAALSALHDQLARLPRVGLMTDIARAQYEAAVHFLVGRVHLLRLDSRTLESTARIESVGSDHDRLIAALLRSIYHLYRGDLAVAKREAARFDELAAVIGSRWTIDVIAATEFVPYHLAGDVLGLKRALHRVERLVAIAPRLSIYREVISAMYEGHRGRPDLALKIYAALDAELAPFSNPIWAQARSHQAECLNTLGKHAEALAICQAARAALTAEDRPFVFAYQQLERESALALAGLGQLEEAARLCDALIAECAAYDNPLVQGLLHRDRARIACAARDREAFELHTQATTAAFATTKNPALIARGKRLYELGRAAGVAAALPSQSEQSGSSLKLERSVRAARILDDVVQATGASAACLYMMLRNKAVLSARHGDSELLDGLSRDASKLLKTLHEGMAIDEVTRALANMGAAVSDTRRFIPLLVGREGNRQQLIALIVLGACEFPLDMTHLDLSEIASELVQDEETELL
ncbi:MAG TPA: protein kinase [Polyangiales bacterium]